MEKLTKVILNELNEWDLSCSEDCTLKLELAKALTNVVKNCNLQNVSVSLLNQIQIQADIYKEREAKAFELADHLKAYENQIKSATVNDILLMIKSNER
jgi:hypothetical protein